MVKDCRNIVLNVSENNTMSHCNRYNIFYISNYLFVMMVTQNEDVRMSHIHSQFNSVVNYN